MRRRTDENQQAVIATLRKHGVSVAVLSSVGFGVPDIMAGFNGVNYLFEVKNLNGRGARLTDAENEFLRTWQGAAHVVFSAEDALRILGITEGENVSKERTN